MIWGRKKKTGTEAKFGNTKVEFEGRKFDSKLECEVYKCLKLFEKAGKIKILGFQDVIHLTEAKIKYIVDFKCFNLETHEEFWVEAKGRANERWPMKKRLWKAYGPGILEIWGGDYRRPEVVGVVIPPKRVNEPKEER